MNYGTLDLTFLMIIIITIKGTRTQISMDRKLSGLAAMVSCSNSRNFGSAAVYEISSDEKNLLLNLITDLVT